jgi:photosystem II stability/assembly factor-like uncharacterized protein
MFESRKIRWLFSTPVLPITFAIGVVVAGFAYSPREGPIPPSRKAAELEGIPIVTKTVDEAITDLSYAGPLTIFGAALFAGLQRSDDGGATWARVDVDTEGWLVNHVDFVDEKAGWAAGDYVLLKTENGGATWTRSKFPVWMHHIDIDFVDRSTGYVAGSTGGCDRGMVNCTYGSVILKTIDGGKSWRKIYSDDDQSTVFQLKAINQNLVFVLYNASIVRRTVNGGKDWEVTYKNRNSAFQIAGSWDGVVWLAGEHSLLKSYDRGQTWIQPAELLPGLNEQKWHAIEFSPEGIGVVGSDGSCIGITQDHGQTWSGYCSPLIKFGLMFDIAISGKNVRIASSSNTAHDSISHISLP